MPQMAPLQWLSLFIVFSIAFILFNIFNYYIYSPQSPKTSLLKTNNKSNSLNWKW
nr:ATP synthase F0 subunit 8 [Lindneromyia sp.]